MEAALKGVWGGACRGKVGLCELTTPGNLGGRMAQAAPQQTLGILGAG